MSNTALIYDITFYQVDEDGNDIIDQKGNTKTYRIKEGLRFKPLEYLVDDIDLDILEAMEKSMVEAGQMGYLREPSPRYIEFKKDAYSLA